MKKHLYTVTTFAKVSVRRYFRDRVALFFTVAFPLIFLLIFGSLSKGSSVNFQVALINQSSSSYAQKFENDLKDSKTFKIDKSVTTLDQAKQKMSRSEVDATLLVPANFG